MGYKKELTGQRFGRLTVVKYVGTKNRKSMWLCKCDCGEETVSSCTNLTGGGSTSCGCKRREVCSSRMKSRNYKHGGTNTRLFRIWTGIKTRCLDQNVSEYPRYGGRGITICDEWKESFSSFRDWALSSGYSDELTCDRIENNKGYSPENCRWVDIKTQQNNKRTNKLLTYKDETHTVSEWERIRGFKRGLILSRLRLGWSAEKAIEDEVMHRKRVV